MTSVCESQENQRWSRRGLPQRPQASDSIGAKFSILLVRPVYLRANPGSLGLRQPHPAQQIGVTRVGAHPVPVHVYT